MNNGLPWQQRRDTAGLIALLQVAEAMHLDQAVCLAETHIDTKAITAAFAQCYSWQELALIRNMQALVDEHHLGLRVASHYTASALGVLGQGMAACDNLLQAAQFSHRYRSFGLSFSNIVIEQRDHAFVIEQSEEGIPEDCRGFLISRGLAGTLTLLRDLVDVRLLPRSVKLRIPVPENRKDFDQIFGVRVEFSADTNCVEFASTAAAIVLPSANQRNRDMFARFCEEVQQTLRDRLGLLDALQAILADTPDIDAVQAAERLRISARSLRRALAETGHSFRQLQLSTRMQKANDLLQQGQAVSAVAYTLGYSETASFSRAFKAHTGLTPQSVRSASLD